jgi:hypothetical protein
MNTLPDSLPYDIKAAFFEYQRKEWEKVLESSKNSANGENQSEYLQHWEKVSNYALAKIREINQQIEKLKDNAVCIANR